MKTDKDINLLEINKELHNKGVEKLIPNQTYFTMADLCKLQDYISNQYTNFNGGFGMSDTRDHAMLDKATDITFSFTTHLELRTDVARRNYRDKIEGGTTYSDKYPYEFNARNCVERLSWLETIIMICEDKGIPFKYHPSIIDEIIAHK